MTRWACSLALLAVGAPAAGVAQSAAADSASCPPSVCYLSSSAALAHAALKAGYSALAYASLGTLGVRGPARPVIATLLPWAVGIVYAAARGYEQPIGDKVHDLAWHSLGAVPLALRRKRWALVASVGLAGATIALTHGSASPRY